MNARHPVTHQILSGRAPEPVQEYAARGLLPIPKHEFLDIWVHLIENGASQEIRDLAIHSLESLKPDELADLIQREKYTPETYRFLAERYADQPEVALALARSRSISNPALEYLARHAPPEVLDVIVVNQTRLLQHPPLVEALKENPALTPTQRRRLMEFEEEFLRKGVQYELKTAPEAEAETALHEMETVALREEAAAEEAAEVAAEEGEEELIPEEIKTLEAEHVRHPERVHQKILTMTVPEKIMLALFGSRTMRMILIRDPNRLVSEAVVKSSKLTESEAESIATMRHLDSEVLRILASRREFLRNRTFVFRLASNPKTPLPVAMRLVNQLNIIQLRDLARSRDVPEAIRRLAKERLNRLRGARG